MKLNPAHDIFDDNKAIEEKVRELKSHARETISQIDKMGGAINSIEFMKTELVKANTERLRSIENGNKTIVGVNKFKETDASPLTNSTNNFLLSSSKVQQTKEGRILERLPLGPSTKIFCPSNFTLTFSGTSINCLPIRDIFF